jgi:putative FmdB family regulatory protein
MPTYEYRCNACGFEFEEFQSMVADPLEECPRCGGVVRRLISGGSGLIFKGSGFYETDYKRKSFGDRTSEKSSEKTTVVSSDTTTTTTPASGEKKAT